MLTLFTIPKSFQGHIDIIQRNAIQSWLQIHPECEIILFGVDDKVDKVAAEFGIRHIPDVERNEYGTPLINSAFDIAQRMSTHQLMCYVNTDIILLNDFLAAVQQIHERKDRFLLVGQRWDVDLRQAWDLTKPDWETELRAYVTKVGRLHPPTGIDYFVFPQGQYYELPPFAVGRPKWDNWLIYRTRFLHIPVIDATNVITVVHQNHGYEHVPQSVDGTYNGPEGNRNLDLAGGASHVFLLQDANRILTPQGLKRPKLTIARLRRQMNILLILHPRLRTVVEYIRPLMRLARASYRTTKRFFNIK
jgi:hypothetical protein